jgi:oligopeptide transport system substrate-binding protein
VPQHPANEIVLNNGAEPEWIDPGKCSDSSGGEIAVNLFAGLTQPHPKTLRAMPDVASGWTISEDGRTYTFHLRDTKWSDGKPVTAEDFAWSWKRVLDPRTGSKYASFLYPIRNGAAFNQRAILIQNAAELFSHVTDVASARESLGALLPKNVAQKLAKIEPHGGDATFSDAKLYFEGIEPAQRKLVLAKLTQKVGQQNVTVIGAGHVGVTALDAKTLRVELENPLPYFLDLLHFYTTMPVPRHVIEGLGSQGLNEDLWTRPEHIVTNGPYTLHTWAFRQYFLLQKNPRYWDAKNVATEWIRVLHVESATTGLSMYRAGSMDWSGSSGGLPSEFMDRLREYDDFVLSPYLGVYHMWVNTEAPPMNDVRVRRALALAIDRKSLCEHVMRAGQIPTGDLVPDGLAGYQGLGRPLFDPAKAKALLSEAGYPNAAGLPPITLIYNTSDRHKVVAEAVQQMWKKHLGLHVEIENQEWKVYLKRLKARDFQVARMGWIGDFADPYTFLEILSGYSGNNHSGWRSHEYDRLLDSANREQDPEKRLGILRQAESHAMDAQPIIPLYVYTQQVMLKPYVQGIWENYQDRHPFKYLRIDPRWYDGKLHKPIVLAPPPHIESKTP